MKKVMLMLVIGIGFLLHGNGVFAATVRCTVTEVADDVVILDCAKGVAKIKKGDKVKVKTAKKAAVEGC